jgi:hypothetical protein
VVGAAVRPGDGIKAERLTRLAFEVAGRGVGLSGIAVDVECRRRVEMNRERRRIADSVAITESRMLSISPLLA